jgi:hypothetical protein
MVRVVYVSTATKPMGIRDLEEMLEQARRKNKEKNITGILLYANKTFIQVLEGETDFVDELYEVISKDERHKNCILIEKIAIEQKSFGSWSMGFLNIEDADITKMKGFSDFLINENKEDLIISNSKLVMEVLYYFKNTIQ